jgi:hypothetical protein
VLTANHFEFREMRHQHNKYSRPTLKKSSSKCREQVIERLHLLPSHRHVLCTCNWNVSQEVPRHCIQTMHSTAIAVGMMVGLSYSYVLQPQAPVLCTSPWQCNTLICACCDRVYEVIRRATLLKLITSGPTICRSERAPWSLRLQLWALEARSANQLHKKRHQRKADAIFAKKGE